MNRKSKGINAERELIHLFWSNNWAACRVAGSGSMVYDAPDIIASNNTRYLAIECKATRDKAKYIPKSEIESLERFAKGFGAEAWIGVRFNNQEWVFLMTSELKSAGKNIVITLEHAKNTGSSFSSLIGVK